MTNLPSLKILLACLSMLESNDNDLAVGKAGERGRYQISGTVWKAHDLNAPFRPGAGGPHDPDAAKDIASMAIEERMEGFEMIFHRDPTAFEVYVLWNAPAQIGKPSRKVAERARRYANLVDEMVRKEKKQ